MLSEIVFLFHLLTALLTGGLSESLQNTPQEPLAVNLELTITTEVQVDKAQRVFASEVTLPDLNTAQKYNLHSPLSASVNYNISSVYGNRCDPITHQPALHGGTDFAAPYGTPLYAIADGTIVFVKDGSGPEEGSVIIESIIGTDKLLFKYVHMERSSHLVSVGQKVSAGQHISSVASTGHSTGNHLHLEVRVNGVRIDPENWMRDVGLGYVLDSAGSRHTNNTC